MIVADPSYFPSLIIRLRLATMRALRVSGSTKNLSSWLNSPTLKTVRHVLANATIWILKYTTEYFLDLKLEDHAKS